MADYYRLKSGYMAHVKTGTYQHRDVWEKAHGKIPSNCHIHHKNKVRHDNRLENLECIPAEQHLRMHGLTFQMVNHWDKVRRLQKRKTIGCSYCQTKFTSNHPRAKFCCRKCAQAAQNAKQSEIEKTFRLGRLKTMACPVYGTSFVQNRPFQRHCSVRCSHVVACRAYNIRHGKPSRPDQYRVIPA